MAQQITTIKTERPISNSELLKALQNSLGPIFRHFEEALGDWSQPKVLDIQIIASAGRVNVKYGVGDPEEPNEEPRTGN